MRGNTNVKYFHGYALVFEAKPAFLKKSNIMQYAQHVPLK